MKTRRQFFGSLAASSADVVLRSATPGWLGQIAMLTGRKLKWDPVNEQIVGDEEASRMLSRRMRAPSSL